jgi:hypothetical protein
MMNDEMVVAPLELSQPTMDAPAATVSGDITLDVSGKGLSVTVLSVTLAQPGFATLHAVDAAGELMVLPVLGVSNFLEAGTHGMFRCGSWRIRLPPWVTPCSSCCTMTMAT